MQNAIIARLSIIIVIQAIVKGKSIASYIYIYIILS